MKPDTLPDQSAVNCDDHAAMEAALVSTSMRLHGITSRTNPVKIAAEVLRLNDAVLAASIGRLRSCDQPADFMGVLLAEADPINSTEAT